MIKAGTYRLTKDIENPQPDRRVKRDWRSFPVWKAGWEFLVVEHNRDVSFEALGLTPEQLMALEARRLYTVAQLVGHRWSHEYIGPGDREQYAALEAALEAVPESLEALFTRLGVTDYFARWLVESGRLTPELFEALWEAKDDNGELLANAPVPQGPRLVELLEHDFRPDGPAGERACARCGVIEHTTSGKAACAKLVSLSR